MLKEIKKITLNSENLTANALFFIPEKISGTRCCLFTHGYTSHKGSILTWAQKMMDLNIPTIIFDLPGHFLGGFHDVPSFELFKKEGPLLFSEAFTTIKKEFPEIVTAISGGHSLGALFSLLHSAQSDFIQHQICVGLGSLPLNKPHLFETPFFKDTMLLRSELVSKQLSPTQVLPWIAETKRKAITSDKNIHLIGGSDDIIIGGTEGVEQMAGYLMPSNQVIKHIIPKLPHHLPENAGVFVKKIVQQIINE